ncbi:MAG: hypothetical protein ACQ9IQ_03455 [Nitrospirales bacterium]
MNIFADGLKPVIAFASITLFLLVLDGGPSLPAFGADPYVSGPLSISNIRIFKQSGSGGWTLANELRRNDRYRLTFDIVNRSSGQISIKPILGMELATLHHIRIRMSTNPCYRAFTDQTFGTPWNPTGSTWDITPVNPHAKLLNGRSTQAHLHFVWNCNDGNAMMMNPGLVPRVVALAEFDASLRGGGGGGDAHLLPNQNVGTRYAIGGNCANNRQCVSRRCDAGDGTTKTNRCIPNDGDGRQGEYCTHHKHCGNGLRCKFSAPQAGERTCLR